MEDERTVSLTTYESAADMSMELGELAKALATFQAKVCGMSESGQNPHFRSSYSTLGDAWKAARSGLEGTGLAVSQLPLATANAAGVVTLLMHESGQWIRWVLMLPYSAGRGSAAQAAGSAITYARRYALTAALGLAVEDDDGNAAGPRAESRRAPRQEPPRQRVAGREYTEERPGELRERRGSISPPRRS